MVTYIILAIIILIILWGISAYNSLVKYKNWVKESWSQIDVQLQRRNDLIPNLVETVKGYAKHEEETLTKVIEMRSKLTNSGTATAQEKMAMSDELTGTLKTVFALSENYPELKANQNFLNLQEELTNTENKLSYSRQLYNSTVAKYNTKIQTIPTNIVANLGGFRAETPFEAPKEARNVPTVKF